MNRFRYAKKLPESARRRACSRWHRHGSAAPTPVTISAINAASGSHSRAASTPSIGDPLRRGRWIPAPGFRVRRTAAASTTANPKSPTITMSDANQPDGRRSPMRLPKSTKDPGAEDAVARSGARGSRSRLHPRRLSESLSTLAVDRRRNTATMMARPTVTSAAADDHDHEQDGNLTLDDAKIDLRGGDEGEVHRVQHELDGHEHHQSVAPQQDSQPPPIVNSTAANAKVPARRSTVTATSSRESSGACSTTELQPTPGRTGQAQSVPTAAMVRRKMVVP